MILYDVSVSQLMVVIFMCVTYTQWESQGTATNLLLFRGCSTISSHHRCKNRCEPGNVASLGIGAMRASHILRQRKPRDLTTRIRAVRAVLLEVQTSPICFCLDINLDEWRLIPSINLQQKHIVYSLGFASFQDCTQRIHWNREYQCETLEPWWGVPVFNQRMWVETSSCHRVGGKSTGNHWFTHQVQRASCKFPQMISGGLPWRIQQLIAFSTHWSYWSLEYQPTFGSATKKNRRLFPLGQPHGGVLCLSPQPSRLKS